MSMPVFLNSCSYDHMPNGQQNEWYDFYREATLELEANAFFPLFWMLLFNPDHIKHAKYIDDFDIDDALSQVDREDCFHEFGERRYPYFVVSQQDALKNFSVHDKFHRTLILSGFCLLKIAKISLNSSFFPKPIKR